jgi:hypothetical protein
LEGLPRRAPFAAGPRGEVTKVTRGCGPMIAAVCNALVVYGGVGVAVHSGFAVFGVWRGVGDVWCPVSIIRL